jgi:replicative DNA helicase
LFEVDKCLEFADLKLIAESHIGHFKQYKEFPSIELLVSILRDKLKADQDESIRDKVITQIKKIATNKDIGDLDWVKEKSFMFCKKQQIKQALLESASLIEDENSYDAIILKMKKAISAGIPVTDGLDYNNDIDARYSETYRRCVATRVELLDQKNILNGGLGGGELGIVVAASGGGKSHVLVHFGAQALLQGKNVLHYTLELNERITGIRYDSHITQINSTDCLEKKAEIKQYFEEYGANLGKLRIKHLPAKSTTVNTLKSHMEKLKLKDFVPDLICVDYVGIMRSLNKYELLRLELKEAVQDLRDLAEELDIPIWTALQSNKEGANSDVVDMTNLAEGFSQAQPADVILGLSRKQENKKTGFGHLFIAKNRAGIDGVLYKMHLDTACSTMTLYEQNQHPDKTATEQVEKTLRTAGSQFEQKNSFTRTIKKNEDFFRKVS